MAPAIAYGVTAMIGLGGILFGYDIGVISGVLEMEEFKHTFKYNDFGKGFIVTAFIVGCFLGSLLTTAMSDRFGRKMSLSIGCVVFIAGGITQALSNELWHLYLGRAVSGLAVGVSSTLVPLYNSELAPKEIRGRLITFNQIAMTFGIAVSFWVDYSLTSTHHGWRYAIGGQIIPAVFLLFGLIPMPRSPRWLVKQGDFSGAERTLQRLRQVKDVSVELASIRLSVQEETAADRVGWSALFHGKMRRRLVIGIVIQTCQQLTGINAIMYFAPGIFKDLGFDHDQSDLLAQGINGVVNFLATLVAFVIVDIAGRRTLLITGGINMGFALILLFLLGNYYAHPNGETGAVTITNKAAGYVCLLCIYLFVIGFAYSWGPIGWLLPTELFPTTLRAKGVAITTSANFAWNIIVGEFVPALLTTINFYLFLLFGICCLGMALYVYVAVPETKNMTLEDIEEMFRKKDAVSHTPLRGSIRQERKPLLGLN